MFEKLNQMKKDGTLEAFVKAGLMTAKVYMYIEMYMYIDAKLKVNKKLTKTKAVEDCAHIMNASVETVWRALRIMKTQIISADNSLLKVRQ